MNFQPTDTQAMLSTSVERLLSSTFDLQARLRAPNPRANATLWAAMAELGLMGVEIVESYGGVGGSFEDMAAVIGPLGAGLVSLPFISSAVIATGLLSSASAAQKARWLPSLASGSLQACVAHTEQRARDTLSWTETTAGREGDCWQLSGKKAVVLGGDTADLFLVTGRTSGQPHEVHGLSLFAVPRETEGLKIDAYPLFDGSGAADLTLEGVQLRGDALVGAVDTAYPEIELAWDRGTAAVCADAVGAMERLRDLTLEYLKTREQFGQPIGKFQALQHRMADAYMAIELARSTSLLAIAAIADTDCAARAADVSAAKVTVAQACREVGQTCVQLHGGVALTQDYPAGHYFKRLSMIERLFGDADYHLRRYARLL